ncbi:hypothetical protein [Streptomyces sp. NPDC047009]|uniref:hypothetical protein n=1 Tax=Streptomyces sp. NPDC047009 TaxID=3154496 RepID=UPI003411E709
MTDAPHRPFNALDFPADLRAAQRTAAELYAKLHAHQATLPWSREAHPGWPDDAERGRERPGRPETPGWTPEDAAQYDRLFGELRDATAAVLCHPWWERCKAQGVDGPDLVAARQALKHAEGAIPLGQGDVRAAA